MNNGGDSVSLQADDVVGGETFRLDGGDSGGELVGTSQDTARNNDV